MLVHQSEILLVSGHSHCFDVSFIVQAYCGFLRPGVSSENLSKGVTAKDIPS